MAPGFGLVFKVPAHAFLIIESFVTDSQGRKGPKEQIAASRHLNETKVG